MLKIQDVDAVELFFAFLFVCLTMFCFTLTGYLMGRPPEHDPHAISIPK